MPTRTDPACGWTEMETVMDRSKKEETDLNIYMINSKIFFNVIHFSVTSISIHVKLMFVIFKRIHSKRNFRKFLVTFRPETLNTKDD